MRRILAGAAVLVFAVLALVFGRADRPGPATAQARFAPVPLRVKRLALFGDTPGRNLVNLVERDIPTSWSITPGAEKNIKWSVKLGSKAGYGGPVVLGSKLFIGTNNQQPRNPAVKGDKGILLCLRESDGSFLWQAVHDKLPSGRTNDWPEMGIQSSPVVEGNRVYYVSNRAEVVCASTGGLAAGNKGEKDEKYKSKFDADFIWRLDMIGKLGVFPHNLAVCSPLIVGDLLFVITGNGVDDGHRNVPAPRAPSFLAIHKHTGKVVWQSLPENRILHGQWSNPVYTVVAGTPQVIFPSGDGWLYAFRPRTGEMLWKFDGNPKSAVFRLNGKGDRSDFLATPVVWENKLYVGVGQSPELERGIGRLWCVDLVKATARGKTNKDVSPRNDNFDPTAPVNKSSALAWHYGRPAPGGRGFRFGRTLSTCAVHDGLCYAADFGGRFFCLDARTGKKLWDHDLGAETWCSPYWVGGHVYIGNDRGEVHIFKHGRHKHLAGKVNMGGPKTRVRTAPVACNGVLYITTEEPGRLWAIARR
jgi:outer membrane protein assembly factor BamB